MNRDQRIDRMAARVGRVQLATLAKAVRDPSSYTYELKWDGYRVLALKAGDRVRLLSRNGSDFTGAFREVADEVARLEVDACALDGEVCALDARGMPSFQLLQGRRRVGARPPAPLAYFVFDLPWLGDEDLRALPIEQRRARLAETVASVAAGASEGRLVVSAATEGDPTAILELACKQGLEGIVAKRKGSTYEAGRRPTWLKLKCKLRQEFAIAGHVPLVGAEDAVGGLVLALKEPDGFVYAGNVGTGFDDETRRQLARMLDADRSTTPTARGAPTRGVRFSVPKLVAEVEFTEWTDAGSVRHPSFKGLRADKSADACVRETPVDVAEPAQLAQPDRMMRSKSPK